jgi:hypothetical protein
MEKHSTVEKFQKLETMYNIYSQENPPTNIQPTPKIFPNQDNLPNIESYQSMTWDIFTLGKPFEGKRLSLIYQGTETIPEMLKKPLNEFYPARDEHNGIVVQKESNGCWENLGIVASPEEGKSFWTGCQVPNSDLFFLTVANYNEQIGEQGHQMPKQRIVLYKLTENGFEECDQEVLPNEHYAQNPADWRDSGAILNLDDPYSENHTYLFCARDKENQPCVGQFQFNGKEIQVLEPLQTPKLEQFGHLEVPTVIVKNGKQYLFASTVKNGTLETGIVALSKEKDGEWKVLNNGEFLSIPYQNPLGLYALKFQVESNGELSAFGFVSNDSKPIGQSPRFQFSLDENNFGFGEILD